MFNGGAAKVQPPAYLTKHLPHPIADPILNYIGNFLDLIREFNNLNSVFS
jgi:hypothetical protein